MKDLILALRKDGKNYNEIVKILGCSKSTVAYYCGKGQKEKTAERQRKRRSSNTIISKTLNFQSKTSVGHTHTDKSRKKKDFTESVRKFQKRDNSANRNVNKYLRSSFTWKDVVDKFGDETICYLSGEKINLFENTYHFDHIIPSSKGGDNSLNNLGILHRVVNSMKGGLNVDEFIGWCKKILEHNGYTVIKNT